MFFVGNRIIDYLKAVDAIIYGHLEDRNFSSFLKPLNSNHNVSYSNVFVSKPKNLFKRNGVRAEKHKLK